MSTTVKAHLIVSAICIVSGFLYGFLSEMFKDIRDMIRNRKP